MAEMVEIDPDSSHSNAYQPSFGDGLYEFVDGRRRRNGPRV
jgi:hypothetical protein